MLTTEFTCSVCHKHIIHESDFSTGYGADKDGNKVCFECCGKQDAERLTNLEIGQKMLLYWNGKAITNWPGTLNIKPTYVWVNTKTRPVTQIEFSFSGHKYKALQYGDNTQIAHVRKLQ